ncbi:MAG TPA: redoxin domain-containing protein [Chloroflexota bacterium]
MRAFRENHDRFAAVGATLLGLSVESARAHAAYAQQLELPFLLLSDLNREVVREYGVMYTREQRHREGFYGVSKRAVFVVEPTGIVRYAWITDDSLVEPDLEEVLQAVTHLESTL